MSLQDPTHSSSRTAFFYGTLMAPQVLHRVCHGGMDPSNAVYATHNLHIQPALLQHFRRHRVKRVDYPAILPHAEASVRGTLVTGLTDADIWRLDIFEGDEYQRQEVLARVLRSGGDANVGEDEESGEEVAAETYVWVAEHSGWSNGSGISTSSDERRSGTGLAQAEKGSMLRSMRRWRAWVMERAEGDEWADWRAFGGGQGPEGGRDVEECGVSATCSTLVE